MCSKTLRKTSIEHLLQGNFSANNPKKKKAFRYLGLFICTLSILSFAFNHSWFCYYGCCNTAGRCNALKRYCIDDHLLKILTIILLIWLIKRIEKLAAFSYVVTPPARRLSNEITYYPIQSSVK